MRHCLQMCNERWKSRLDSHQTQHLIDKFEIYPELGAGSSAAAWEVVLDLSRLKNTVIINSKRES